MILGVGNEFRGDDAAGLEAARRLRSAMPQIRIVECRGDLASAMDRWEGENAVIVIDAVASGAAVGTTHRVDARTQPLATQVFRGSTHAFGIAEVVELARTLGRLPQQLIVYGIEGDCFDPGAPIGPAVSDGIDRVVAQVIEEIRRHA